MKKLNFIQICFKKLENYWSIIIYFSYKKHIRDEKNLFFIIKGQGYRCIRVNGHNRRDATIESAANAAGVRYEDLSLPVELTLWVDPKEVCCRFGESKGSYCTLASFDDKENIVPLITQHIEKVEKEEKQVNDEVIYFLYKFSKSILKFYDI